jgi:hypothetical protein
MDFKSSRPGNKMKEPLHRLQQENKAKLGRTISHSTCIDCFAIRETAYS